MEALADVNIDGFMFRIPELDGDGRRALLEVDTPFGRPDIGARIEISQRPLSLPADLLSMIPLPIHDRYDVSVPDTPATVTRSRRRAWRRSNDSSSRIVSGPWPNQAGSRSRCGRGQPMSSARRSAGGPLPRWLRDRHRYVEALVLQLHTGCHVSRPTTRNTPMTTI